MLCKGKGWLSSEVSVHFSAFCYEMIDTYPLTKKEQDHFLLLKTSSPLVAEEHLAASR